MNNNEAWIALSLIPNIGPKSVLKLLEVYKSPEDIFDASPSEIRDIGILNKIQQDALMAGPDQEATKTILEKLHDNSATALSYGDHAYPRLLKEISDPPCVLYCKGSLKDLEPAVAVVGTRSPSHYGKEMAYRIANELSMNGIAVVSGLARGIDTQAHMGALSEKSPTVAVLGSGIDIVYPQENSDLAEKIASQGAVISEFAPGTIPDARNFPRRNRIISGLANAVVVVESTQRSGALITARFAAEQNRLCMAVPGNVTNVRTQGPHSLIRQGATLIESAADVIMEIAPQLKCIFNTNTGSASESTDKIVDLVHGQILSIEEIADELGIHITEAAKRISLLELSGTVTRIEGNKFIARSTHG